MFGIVVLFDYIYNTPNTIQYHRNAGDTINTSTNALPRIISISESYNRSRKESVGSPVTNKHNIGTSDFTTTPQTRTSLVGTESPEVKNHTRFAKFTTRQSIVHSLATKDDIMSPEEYPRLISKRSDQSLSTVLSKATQIIQTSTVLTTIKDSAQGLGISNTTKTTRTTVASAMIFSNRNIAEYCRESNKPRREGWHVGLNRKKKSKQGQLLTKCLLAAMHTISDNDLPQDLRAFNPNFPITIHEELLEVLDVFAQEMTSHNLTYVIAGGTLIGSWRHHGFIPWDDDADVYMYVEDRPKLKVNFQTNECTLYFRRLPHLLKML